MLLALQRAHATVIDLDLTEDISALLFTRQASRKRQEGRRSISRKSGVTCSRVFSVVVCKL